MGSRLTRHGAFDNAAATTGSGPSSGSASTDELPEFSAIHIMVRKYGVDAIQYCCKWNEMTVKREKPFPIVGSFDETILQDLNFQISKMRSHKKREKHTRCFALWQHEGTIWREALRIANETQDACAVRAPAPPPPYASDGKELCPTNTVCLNVCDVFVPKCNDMSNNMSNHDFPQLDPVNNEKLYTAENVLLVKTNEISTDLQDDGVKEDVSSLITAVTHLIQFQMQIFKQRGVSMPGVPIPDASANTLVTPHMPTLPAAAIAAPVPVASTPFVNAHIATTAPAAVTSPLVARVSSPCLACAPAPITHSYPSVASDQSQIHTVDTQPLPYNTRSVIKGVTQGQDGPSIEICHHNKRNLVKKKENQSERLMALSIQALQPPKKPLICHKCGQEGHKRWKCPGSRKGEDQNRTFSRQQSGPHRSNSGYRRKEETYRPEGLRRNVAVSNLY